jgi:hypothetical protein
VVDGGRAECYNAAYGEISGPGRSRAGAGNCQPGQVTSAGATTGTRMIQLGVALGLLIALVAGVIWVVVRELARGSRRRREREARWQAELRQDVAADPRFWRADAGLGQTPAGAGWAADEPHDG